MPRVSVARKKTFNVNGIYIPEQTIAKESLQSVKTQEIKTEVDVCALAAPSPAVAGIILFN